MVNTLGRWFSRISWFQSCIGGRLIWSNITSRVCIAQLSNFTRISFSIHTFEYLPRIPSHSPISLPERPQPSGTSIRFWAQNQPKSLHHNIDFLAMLWLTEPSGMVPTSSPWMFTWYTMVFHDQDDRNVGFLDQILTCKSSNAEDNIIGLLENFNFLVNYTENKFSKMTWKRRGMIWEGCGIDIDPIRWIGNDTRILDEFELKIWSKFRWAEASQTRKSVIVVVSVVNNRKYEC